MNRLNLCKNSFMLPTFISLKKILSCQILLYYCKNRNEIGHIRPWLSFSFFCEAGRRKCIFIHSSIWSILDLIGIWSRQPLFFGNIVLCKVILRYVFLATCILRYVFLANLMFVKTKYIGKPIRDGNVHWRDL